MIVLMTLSDSAIAAALFHVTATGTPANINITLCLNGVGAISCQNLTVSASNLSIRTLIPNHTYPNAGIKINTPGYELPNCAVSQSGYCLFSVSATTPMSILVAQKGNSYSINGSISGLVSSGLTLQLNGSEDLCISANSTSFAFSNRLAYGANYAVTVKNQPSNLGCIVDNGTGTVSNANVDTITVICSPPIVYVSSDSTQSEYYCSLNVSNDPDVNGTLHACSQTPSNNQLWEPFATSLGTFNGTQYSYVADNFNNRIAQCLVNTDSGSFGSNPCSSVNAGIQFNTSPTGIALATVQGVPYAYVSDNVGGDVYLCTIDAFTGGFTMCTPTPTFPPSWRPFSLAVAIVNGAQYAYVAGGLFDHNVYQCQIDVNGTLINPCNVTPSGAPTGNWNPDTLTFATVNNIQYAYVASDLQDVYQCTLGSDGSFTACALASGGGIPWDPRGISFGTVNNIQYAYVADINGNLYRCTLYATNDSTNGTFQNCTITTPSAGPTPLWSPRAVTLALVP